MQRTVGDAHRAGRTLKDAFRATHEALAPKFGAWPIFEHCLPFDVQRLWDELDGIERPVIWTAERDRAGLGRAAGLTAWLLPVLVIGCGPVGQTAALLLARWGLPVVVLDGRPARDAVGSKAICQQRDVLDVWDAVGVGAEVARRGVTWTTARTFYRDTELFSFTFADRGRSPFPPFVNISQCDTEQLLDERIAAEPLVEVRWGHRVTGIEQDAAGVTLTCATGDGEVRVERLLRGGLRRRPRRRRCGRRWASPSRGGPSTTSS